MKNEEVWSQYQDYTRDLTEFSRKLAFGGIAVFWVLKLQNGSFSDVALKALFCIVGFFLFDILQSLTSALLLRNWIRGEEARQWVEIDSINGDYKKPYWIDYPAFTLFLAKILMLLLGFGFLGLELLGR